MAKWSKTKVDSNDINNGNEYGKKDRPTREQLNAIVNNSFYASNIAENVASQIANLDPNEKIEFNGSNPNLLINGDFRINQRGQESYTQTGVYTIDRWIKWFNGSLIITNNAIQLISTGSDNAIQQTVEDTSIIGKVLTLSMEFSTDGINYQTTSCTGVLGNNFVYNEMDNIYFGVNNDIGFPFVSIKIAQNTTLYVKYIKFELGSVATPFIPQPYAEELAMCQRYYQKAYISFTSVSTSDSTILGFINLPVTLRTTPTLSNIDLYGSEEGGVYIGIPNSYTFYKLSSNGILLQINYSNLKSNFMYYISSGINEIEFDAEIY